MRDRLLRTALLALLLGSASSGAVAADRDRAPGCDALAVRLIRATGASLAGRTGSLAVFRAADADRMSLDCRTPPRIVLGSLDREPRPGFFVLAGLAASGLAGAEAGAAEILALNLHQASLLSGAPREGRIGRLRMRCETGPRQDGLAGDLSVCVLAALPRRGAALPPAPPPG